MKDEGGGGGRDKLLKWMKASECESRGGSMEWRQKSSVKHYRLISSDFTNTDFGKIMMPCRWGAICGQGLVKEKRHEYLMG